MPDADLTRLLLHGGAGDLPADAGDLAAQRDALAKITSAIAARLRRGSTAVDAVVEAVARLEDCPLFNAGVGAVLNRDGLPQLDAAVMDGISHACGAVAAVSRVRSPVRLAQTIMQRGDFAFFAGADADALAAELGMECVAPEFFVTPERTAQLVAARRRGAVLLDHDVHHAPPDAAFGTVGAVARDDRGRLAAATSTGGLTNKPPGRIGDTPVIGAGTWASRRVAISCTGTGESFIRAGFARGIDARLQWARLPLAEACEQALAELLHLAGRGGCIAVDAEGHCYAGFNSRSMFRAWLTAGGRIEVAVHDHEARPPAY
ncbi:MAG: isoaspartyl peptidase/L-asparaginase [Gammaproteobacteria bacterium]|nr:isoaspartyl peptidase/L-asparaginase [Gammaproteobacteria bacterium]